MHNLFPLFSIFLIALSHYHRGYHAFLFFFCCPHFPFVLFYCLRYHTFLLLFSSFFKCFFFFMTKIIMHNFFPSFSYCFNFSFSPWFAFFFLLFSSFFNIIFSLQRGYHTFLTFFFCHLFLAVLFHLHQNYHA